MLKAGFGAASGVVNGISYVAGGVGNARILNSVEAYDPSTNIWSTKVPMPTARFQLAAKAKMAAGRIELAIGVVGSRLYAIGSLRHDILKTTEAYNPATDNWTEKMPALTKRYSLAAVS